MSEDKKEGAAPESSTKPISNNTNTSQPLNKPIEQNQQSGTLSGLLGDNNLIIKYIRYMATQYDGYADWNLAAALELLAVIADKKLTCEMRHSTIYTNLNIMCIGKSTISRKTTGIDKGKSFAHHLGLESKKLPDSFSPERFIEEMSNKPHAYYWKDEAASVLAAMQKNYMNEFRDMLMDLYECHDYNRALRTSQRKDDDKKTEFNVNDTYLNIWWATTPENFANYATVLDVTSGWLLRFIYFYPTGDKPWMGFAELTEADRMGWKELFDLFKFIKDKIDRSAPINMKFTPEALKYYNDWQRDRETEIAKNSDSVVTGIFGRLETYAVKLAMLFEFADPNFFNNLKGDTNGRNMGLISLDKIKAACLIVDGNLIPSSVMVVSKIEEDKDMKDENKIMEYLSKKLDRATHNEISKSQILRDSHLSAKRANVALESLVQKNLVIRRYEEQTEITWFHF